MAAVNQWLDENTHEITSTLVDEAGAAVSGAIVDGVLEDEAGAQLTGATLPVSHTETPASSGLYVGQYSHLFATTPGTRIVSIVTSTKDGKQAKTRLTLRVVDDVR